MLFCARVHIGLASGLSVGFSIGLGGVGAVALGVIADSVGLRTALLVCAGAALAAVAIGVFLPATGRRQLAPEIALP
jgi:FSR family fosmidomycin resistance protein-like MFS transporter